MSIEKFDLNTTLFDEQGREILDSTPIPRLARVGAESLYEVVMRALKAQREQEAGEEYDSVEEFYDFSDDEGDEPLTDAERAALDLERKLYADSTTAPLNAASKESNTQAKADEAAVSPETPNATAPTALT